MPQPSQPIRLPARYRLYVDESGDHAYNRLDEISHRYLALLGVWFRQPDDYVSFADDDAFGKHVVPVAEEKFNHDEASGQVVGYGKVYLPRNERTPRGGPFHASPYELSTCRQLH
jgi:hypothetical protein